ncbi:DUF6339 family protein [Propionivibrio sp.]|uniref:DUF6339 family protein n=1 Tax=Propionivibrio sp. TaxID=2212460 RepID=UPI003BEF8DD1
MKANFLKSAKVQELQLKVEENLDLYRNGNFDFLVSDTSCHFETSLVIDVSKLALITSDKINLNEVDNCLLMYQAMGTISHYLARDERLWVYLCHTQLLEYTRARWPIPQDDEKAIKHIKNHFFCIGARGIERDNAASRLWWQASLCSRANGITFEEALTCVLHQSDVRANIIERPTTSQNVIVFSAVLKKLNESYKSNKELFERDRFRSIMKELNLIGGVKLLAALPESTIAGILDQCVAKAA